MATSPVAPAEDQLAALQKELRDNKAEVARLNARPPVQAAPSPVQSNNGIPSKAEIEKEFWGNPLPIVDAIAKRAAYETEQRITANSADTNRAVARDKVRVGDPDVFDKYEVEITDMVAKVAPQFQGNINVWQNALSMVRGQHIDEIVAARMEKAGKETPKVNTEPNNDGPRAPSHRQPPPPKEKALTADQLEVARGLGLDEQEYRRGQQRYDNQDKEWGKVVTFSSEERRRAIAKSKSAGK